ncbi:MAG: metallophosphoesterase [Myxococcota bacterium]
MRAFGAACLALAGLFGACGGDDRRSADSAAADAADDSSAAADTDAVADDSAATDTSVVDTSVVDSAATDSAATDSAATDTTIADATATPDGDDAASDASDATAPSTCPPCVNDSDCGGDVCAQLGGDSYCAPRCGAGDSCAADRACLSATSVAGDQESLCVPRSDVCSVVDEPGTPTETVCGTLVAPSVTAACHACTQPPCQANGCYGGWWCNTAGNHCLPPPTTCDPGGALDAGPAVIGSVDKDGGTLSRLVFAVVGDTRPPSKDDNAAYPTATITQVYQHVEAFLPHVPFVVATGDYVFAGPTTDNGAIQLDLYLGARAGYSGVVYPALGNHECTGYTRSNCGLGAADGVTRVYQDFLTKMLGPLEKTEPYYVIRLAASDATWTAKLVFVAANAWSEAQATWLDATLSEPTTYTFIVRHEPAYADTAPGTTPSQAIMAQHPYTLAITGHSHTYRHDFGSREIIVGNGGAPLSSKSYGYAIIHQRDDGTLQVDMLDYATDLPDLGFRFGVKADGTLVP